MSPRENLLQTLRCEKPQWIPVCPYLFSNENPVRGVPEALGEVFRLSSGALAGNILKLGEYLGADDYLLPVPAPADLVSDTCSVETREAEKGKFIKILSTPKGQLRQISEAMPGYPGMVTERYVKALADVPKLIEYFNSLRVRAAPETVKKIQDVKKMAGGRGALFCRTNGTPLGMCYRVYSDITNLIYMIADEPGTMKELFDCMEEKYFKLYEGMLRAAPEIDAFFGMDDTSTTLISPDMFDSFNVELINRRADLCHANGKIYMHHSCGLIRGLLPVYRKTRMNGVDAFIAPPVGNVGYAEGREILGPGYSMIAGLANGLGAMDEDAIHRHVARRFKDARMAGNVVFYVGGAHLSFTALEMIFAEARKLKTRKES